MCESNAYIVRDGKEVSRQMVDKAGCQEGRSPGEGHHHGGGGGNGRGRGRGGGRGARFELLEGCDVLIARGMGRRAVERAGEMSLEIIVCDEKDIDAALAAYLGGELGHNPKRIHPPHQ